VLVIGVTGAILVFRQELQSAAYPQFFRGVRLQPEEPAPAAVVMRELQHAYAGYRVSGIDWPTYRRQTFLVYVSRGDEFRTVFADPVTGRVVGELPFDWIRVLQELHFNLLGGATGRRVNGVGAALLLLMTLTGLYLWSPRFVQPRLSLRHVHAAVGAWPSVILVAWALTGMYFAFPLPPAPAPESGPAPASVTRPTTDVLLERARLAAPSARPARLVMPFGERGTFQIVMARGVHGDWDTSDEVLLDFDQYSGDLLGIRDSGRRTAIQTVRSWVLPIHAGMFGGLTVKMLWAIFALALPALFITGVLMWLRA
jgi:uncharacterized iron-regulated membrane protein